MTRREIKQRREAIERELAENKAARQAIIARWRVLQGQCPHSKRYEYHVMGEMGVYCPDCGWT